MYVIYRVPLDLHGMDDELGPVPYVTNDQQAVFFRGTQKILKSREIMRKSLVDMMLFREFQPPKIYG